MSANGGSTVHTFLATSLKEWNKYIHVYKNHFTIIMKGDVGMHNVKSREQEAFIER